MGKRIAPETQVPSSKKKLRKTKTAKALDFDTDAADGAGETYIRKTVPFNSLAAIYVGKTPKSTVNQSNKQANNSSIILKRTPLCAASPLDVFNHTESPKPVYSLRPSLVNGTILKDLKKKLWRLGPPIGKGNFGEIFLASDDIGLPVTNDNAKFVVKIEPHSNGPLFVEIHCLINTAKSARSNNSSALTGIPAYIASGSHYFGDARYRFLVLPRFDCDLHSLIRKCRIQDSSVLTLGLHILDTLEVLHNHGYCHNDIKAQNLMITRREYDWKEPMLKNHVKSDYEEIQHTTDSGNSSEQEIEDHSSYQNGNKKSLRKRKNVNYAFEYDDCFITKANYLEDDEVITTTTTNSNDSNSYDAYSTPITTVPMERRRRRAAAIQYQGSNPVRSCRKKQDNTNTTMYDEMVKSHYLRPRGRISYSEFFSDDCGTGCNGNESPASAADYYFKPDTSCIVISSDDDSDEFQPSETFRRSSKSKQKTSSNQAKNVNVRRLTRRQAKSNVDKNRFSTENNFVMFRNSVEDEIYLIDFGLASKFRDDGIHRPFLMDQRRAHDGTLEFTSRDAHLGAHSRRSDLECLGYNLLFWSQGYLPWREEAKQQQQEQVHRAKECLMTDVRTILKKIYGDGVPSFIGEYLNLVGELGYQERPDYARYRKLFKKAFRQLQTNCTENDPMKLCRKDILRNRIPIKFQPEKNVHETSTPVTNGYHHIESIFDSNKQVNGRFSITSRVSPKNLRSKGKNKADYKEARIIDILPASFKRLSWPEILSQNPDDIAQDRAEKEFEREEKLLSKSALAKPRVRQYQGKPTYAILEMLQKRGAELPAIKLELRVKRENNDSTWRLASHHKNQY